MGAAIRIGTLNDVRALVRMHAECSPASVERRYLAPMPMMGAHLATRLLCPAGGFSLVSERANALVAVSTVAPYDGTGRAEVGELFVDRCQRQGIGTALLVAATRHAARRGFAELVLMAHPDNRAVLPMVNAAGLRARVKMRDGFTQVVITLPRAGAAPTARADGGERVPARLHSARASANN
ncbi:MAG: GNAT family N-acetyltransferase [Propionibacteriales bacterium]|nr:GNAT family N-acetyltransferase [Propionibacteriales bacterium]